MGFGGGGGAQLTNHVHDNTPLQGGPLDLAGVTIGSLNSGDLTYSDGAALQQLAISAPNDQLRVSAGNIPEWFTPAAGAGGQMQLVSHSFLAADATEIDSSFAEIDQDDVSNLRVVFNGRLSTNVLLRLQINGITNNYDYGMARLVNASETYSFSNGQASFEIVPQVGNDLTLAFIDLSVARSNTAAADQDCNMHTYGGGNSTYVFYGNGENSTNVTGLNRVRIFPASGNILVGATMDIFRINNS